MRFGGDVEIDILQMAAFRALVLLAFAGLLRGSCLSDPLCLSCTGETCTSCVQSILDKRTGLCRSPTTLIESCLEYDSDSNCIECFLGRSLKDGQCLPIEQPGCVKTDSSGKCLMCSKGVLVSAEGLCDPRNLCSVFRCRYCQRLSGEEICAICDKGFVLRLDSYSLGTCVPDEKESKNCMMFGQGLVCVRCRLGYFDSAEGCVKSGEYSESQVLGEA